MRAVIQRVSSAEVSVAGETVGSIRTGLLVLVCAERGDTAQDARRTAEKIAGMRIFQDGDGKMNASLHDVGGEVLAVSQFTLCADLKKGRRPSFVRAADPRDGMLLVEAVLRRFRELGVPVHAGRFGEHMQVRLTNDGPVTVVLDVVDGAVVQPDR